MENDLDKQLKDISSRFESCLARHDKIIKALENEDIETANKLMKGNN